jgi:hypothetical protein
MKGGTSNVQRSTFNVELAEIARRALPLMGAAQRAEAERLLAEVGENTERRTSNAEHRTEDETLEGWKQLAAEAWEHDMLPARTALAAALQHGGQEVLRGLRHLLPALLRGINRAPAFAGALAQAMAARVGAGDSALRTANAAAFEGEPAITEALRQWRSREIFETDLGSADLAGFSRQMRERAIFSARVTNTEFLQEVATVVDEMLSGTINQATGRLRLLKKLAELGYDPAIGFPGDMASIPPAERGSLQDLSSRQRLDLILETNMRMAAGYAQVLAGNTPYMLREYPAWELLRLYPRDVPRGSAESKSIGWERRWSDAGESVAWEGAVETPMIARKDSPLWQALGDGAGGYRDTLGNPYPPFAFRSGKAWRPVARARCAELGLAEEPAAPMPAQLTPGQAETQAALRKLGPDFRDELLRELEAEREQVRAVIRTEREGSVT